MSDEITNTPNPPAAPKTLSAEEIQTLKENVIDAIRTCYDPEIPVNIYELGLIYDIQVEAGGKVVVKMTLTAPGCPAAGSLPGEVEDKIALLPHVKEVQVDVVWDPPWNMERMSEAAKLQLGLL